MTFAWLLDPLLSLVMPPRCGLCGHIGDAWLCCACAALMPPPSVDACDRCDHPGAAAHCPDCEEIAPSFERVRALGPHAGYLREAVLRLKYRGAWRLSDPLAARMARRVPDLGVVGALDFIVAVPQESSRLSERGYNQAALLASRIAVRLGVRHAPSLLERVAATGSQRELSWQARQDNVAQAFRAAPASLQGLNILLVDDVMTSGATLNACSGALVERGARVWGLVAARGTLHSATLSGGRAA